jgi:hypothetical protein
METLLKDCMRLNMHNVLLNLNVSPTKIPQIQDKTANDTELSSLCKNVALKTSVPTEITVTS